MSALKWIEHSKIDGNKDIHFFVDSLFVKNTLCGEVKTEIFFYLKQEIDHIADRIKKDKHIYIHWIPSHIDKYTHGQFIIDGNKRADILAVQAQGKATVERSNEEIRERILSKSIELIWRINTLILRETESNGPSPDDFSPANANQIAHHNLCHLALI